MSNAVSWHCLSLLKDKLFPALFSFFSPLLQEVAVHGKWTVSLEHVSFPSPVTANSLFSLSNTWCLHMASKTFTYEVSHTFPLVVPTQHTANLNLTINMRLILTYFKPLDQSKVNGHTKETLRILFLNSLYIYKKRINDP